MSAWETPDTTTATRVEKTDAESTEPPAEADAGPRAQYMSACTDYLRRQIIIYEHWPQRKYNELGYLDEKVFRDQNA